MIRNYRVLIFFILLVFSQIGEAKSFFDKKYDLMLSLYQQGQTQVLQKKYNNAITSYTNALDYAMSINNTEYIGLINRDLAEVFNLSYNKQEALTYYANSVSAFEKCNRVSDKNFSLLQMGRIYFDIQDYNKANKVFKSLLIASKANKDTVLEINVIESYAGLELARKDRNVNLAINMLLRIPTKLKGSLNEAGYGLLSYAYALNKDNNKAIQYLDSAKNKITSLQEETDFYLKSYQVNSLLGNEKASLRDLENYTLCNKKLQINMLRQAVLSSQKEYFQQKNIAQENYIKALNFRLWLGFSLIIILGIVVAWLTIHFRQKAINQSIKQKEETDKLLSIAEDLENKLIIEKQKSQYGKKQILSKIDVLERLCEQYYIFEGSDNLQPKLLNEVKKVIDQLRNNISSLESSINQDYNGLISRLRQDMPNIKDDDVKLYCYLVLGFSSTTISALIEKDKSVVYNRISRLKTKISNLDTSNKEDFLRVFDKS